MIRTVNVSRSFWLPLAAMVSLIWLSLGCDQSSSQKPPEAETKLHVVCTVYPLADLAKRIGGAHVDVDWFCEAGRDPRDLKLTDEQIALARRADVIVTSGFRDQWAGDFLSKDQRQLRLLRPESTPTGRKTPLDHAALWLVPQIALETAELMREKFTMLDSRHSDDYRAAYEAVAGDLRRVESDCKARLSPLQGKKFLSLRPMWGTLAAQYGLEEFAPVAKEAHQLSADDIRRLKDRATDEAIDILAVDASLPPGVRREVADRTGLTPLPLDPLGTSAPEGRSTWERLMQYNLQQLENGLK